MPPYLPPVPTVVFAGPSLPQRVRPTGELTWRPPAGRGDLEELDLEPGSRIVLVDGYLVHRHPPSPTEVLNLVDRGFEVWGCSSLGALRAAELRDHGMRGFGWVYEHVVDRTITYDDELVAALDPRTNEATGLFLANIRYGLYQLTAAGHATERQALLIIEGLRHVHFRHRTGDLCRELAASAGLAPPAIGALLATDVKREDAVDLLAQLMIPVPIA